MDAKYLERGTMNSSNTATALTNAPLQYPMFQIIYRVAFAVVPYTFPLIGLDKHGNPTNTLTNINELLDDYYSVNIHRLGRFLNKG